MYESSPRSREVANALFQIERLTEEQTRSILRHITIDDAVLNEALCSHVASVISGTLHKVPREGVNATLTCGTGLDAASHWEKSYASHPGHVSATFRKQSINGQNEADQSKKQMVLFKPEQFAPAPTNDASVDVKPAVGFSPDLKGLSIINKGQLTLHYHSYHDASSSTPRSASVSRKRALDRGDDEEYSEALASLMDFDLSPESRRNPPPSPKRQRLEEPDIEMVEPEVEKSQEKVKKEEEEPAPKNTKKNGPTCKKCGNSFKPKQNKGSNTPCNYHPGTFRNYASGVKPKGKQHSAKKPLHDAWSCCKNGADSIGCVSGKHKSK